MFGKSIAEALDISEERADALIHWFDEAIFNKTVGMEEEISICKFVAEEAMKQNWTTTELVYLAYKMGNVFQVMYPYPMTELIRLQLLLWREKK